MSFNQLRIDTVENKFNFINKASRRIMQHKKEKKDTNVNTIFIDILDDMIVKENKKGEK